MENTTQKSWIQNIFGDDPKTSIMGVTLAVLTVVQEYRENGSVDVASVLIAAIIAGLGYLAADSRKKTRSKKINQPNP